ncbi:MAG: phosphatidylserine decarboxylase [Planctomycetes bacterium]|nr:phosphatidylserine decarboxylase [Planctomycetota bacterium]
MSSTPLRRGLSLFVGWLTTLAIPRPLRAPLYRAYSRAYGVDLSEVRLPLEEHPNFAAFFVRRLVDGARSFPADPAIFPSPCDGTVQSIDEIHADTILQAKGRPYSVRELLGPVGTEVELEGGTAWTIYLSPRDYHRVHTPVAGRLVEAVWLPGARYSVAPKVLAARAKVFSINERCVMRIETGFGPLFYVMVGALNVGRIRVVGVEPASSGKLATPRTLARGDELARFEMGSTVICIVPRSGPRALAGLELGRPLAMGEAIGHGGR